MTQASFALVADLEADLGIDTVKQAETFSALRELFGIPTQSSFSLRGHPTLRSVVRFVCEHAPAASGAAAPSPAPAAGQPDAAASAESAEALGAADRAPRRVPVALLRPPVELCLGSEKPRPERGLLRQLQQVGLAAAIVAEHHAQAPAPARPGGILADRAERGLPAHGVHLQVVGGYDSQAQRLQSLGRAGAPCVVAAGRAGGHGRRRWHGRRGRLWRGLLRGRLLRWTAGRTAGPLAGGSGRRCVRLLAALRRGLQLLRRDVPRRAGHDVVGTASQNTVKATKASRAAQARLQSWQVVHVFWDDQRRKIHVERILYQRSVGNTGSFEPVARSTDRNDVADAWAVDPP